MYVLIEDDVSHREIKVWNKNKYLFLIFVLKQDCIERTGNVVQKAWGLLPWNLVNGIFSNWLEMFWHVINIIKAVFWSGHIV